MSLKLKYKLKEHSNGPPGSEENHLLVWLSNAQLDDLLEKVATFGPESQTGKYQLFAPAVTYQDSMIQIIIWEGPKQRKDAMPP